MYIIFEVKNSAVYTDTAVVEVSINSHFVFD